MKKEAFIAICKCGGIVMACVDDSNDCKDTAKEVAKFIRRGYEIKKVPVEDVRTAKFCNNHGKCINENSAAKAAGE